MAVAIAGTPAVSTLLAGTTLVATAPAGITVGELLRLNVSTTLDVAVTTPAGWTPIVAVGDGFGSGRIASFYRIADGSEGGSVSVTVGSCDAVGQYWRVTGFDAVTPINTSASNSNTSGSTTAITSPSVTTTVANCMIERSCESNEAASIANPGGQTNIGSGSTGSGALDDTQAACYATQAGIGASGTADFVATGGDRPWTAITIAIAPALGPTINTQPQTQRVLEGNTATFNISATASAGSLSYQWYFDGGAVGSNSNSYARTNCVFADNNKDVYCDVTDSNGTVSSVVVKLFVSIAAKLFYFKA